MNRMKKKPSPDGFWLAYALCWLLLFALLLCCGCSRKGYVPIETVRADSVGATRADTVWRERVVVVRDSAARRDSVYIKERVREVVDTAGRVLRTDRELEQATVRETERYASLLSDYRELEREYEQLNRAYLERREVAVPVARPPTLRERLPAAFGFVGVVAVGAVICWLRCRRLRRQIG